MSKQHEAPNAHGEIAFLLRKADSTDTLLWRDAETMAGAILATGYRKPRTITTDAELDELPAETIIRDSWGDPIAKDDEGYWHYGEIPVMEPRLPATVLWEPNEPVGGGHE
jgi:hypothetical protein